MNTFRKLSIFVLIAIVAVAAVGVVPTQHQAKAQGETLVIWHAWQDAEKDLLDAWIANYSGDVSIDARFIPFDDLRSTYETAAATGEGPDLLIGAADWAGGFDAAGIALPLNDVIADTELEANLPESAWNLMGVAGTYYGIPVTLDGVSFYYNLDFIDEDEVPETFEDMLELGVELTGDGDVGLIFNSGFYHTAGIYFGLGGELFDEVEGINLWNTDEAAVRYLELHREVFQASSEIYGGSDTLFTDGRAAMIIEGSWRLGDFRNALGDRLGMALLPDVDGSPWAPFFGGKGFYVNPTGNVEVALDFLTYVTSVDGLALGAEIAGHIPPTDAVEVDDPYIANFAAQFALGVPLPTSPMMNAYWGNVGDAITGVTERGEAPEAAAAAAQALIEQALSGGDE